MNIYFVSVGIRPFAKYMVTSFKKYIPDSRLIQITDRNTPLVDGADVLIQYAYDGWWENMMLYMVESFSKVEDDVFITANDDCILNGSIEDVLEGDYDVAIVKRHKPKIDKDGNDIAKMYPYSNGIVVVKNRHFYIDCYLELSKNKDLWAWFGDMDCIKRVIEAGKYKVKELPQEVYCKIPTKVGQGDESAVLWHYAGTIRKEWMQYHGINA